MKVSSTKTGLGGLGDSRSELVDKLALVVGREKAEALVADLEGTVSKAASDAATTVVKRGIIIGGVVSVVGVLLAGRLSR